MANQGNFRNQGGQQGGSDKGQQAAGAHETASSAMDRAREMASSAAQTAGNVASQLGERAGDATSALGSGMQSLAGTLRQNVPGGMFGSASSAVADTLERGGRYLQEQGIGGIGEDLTRVIRRNPIPAVLVGIAVGFLFARATNNRS